MTDIKTPDPLDIVKADADNPHRPPMLTLSINEKNYTPAFNKHFKIEDYVFPSLKWALTYNNYSFIFHL